MPTGRRAAIAWAALAAAGCAAERPPQVLRFDAARYGEAFDAAIAAAHRRGMPPELRDRRGGIIETQPVLAPSWLEPWRSGASRESTVTMERRRVRFEFVAAGTPQEPVDLLAHEGEIDLRVWVLVERAFAPGVRRDTWSRALTTRAVIIRSAAAGSPPVSDFWEPIHRDLELEQELLAAIAK
jgi:hypothetical protein